MNTPLVATGTRIRNPFTLETFIFTHPCEDPAETRFDVNLEPGGVSAGNEAHHIHPLADEYFTVREGRLRVFLDGKAHEIGPGETVMVPRGTPHYFRNGHDGETYFHIRFTPGQQFLRFFLNMALGPATLTELYDAKGDAPLLLQALFFRAFPDHAYKAGQSVFVQKAAISLLAPLGRLAGYRLPIPPAPRERLPHPEMLRA